MSWVDTEMKPCPFCGASSDDLYIVPLESARWLGEITIGIFCDNCKQTVVLEENETEGDTDESREKAIKAWNRRSRR